MTKEWTKVEFDLPFVIPVDNGVYEVFVRGAKSRVSIQRVQRASKIGLFNFGNSLADLKHDTHGRLAFSKISVEVPGRFGMATRRDKFFDSDRLTVIEKALEHLNRLTDVSRHVTGNFSLARVRYPDTLGFSLFHVSDGKEVPVAVGFSTGTGGVTVTTGQIRYLTGPQKGELIRSLQEERQLEPSVSFLLDAKSALLDEDYGLATVLGVVALEITLSKFAMERGKKKGLKPEQIQEMVKMLGIKASIDSLLKLLLETNDSAPDDEIVKSCSGAITMRNHVVHEGLRSIPRDETQDRVVAIEKMVTYLTSLVP